MKAMVLAAGEGNRLRPLTETMPKPMLPIAGTPLLERTVASLAAQGVREIVMNLHHHPEAITAHFGNGSSWNVTIHYSFEPSLLGTAGALKPWRQLFDATFLVVYGDNLLSLDVRALAACHRRCDALATVALFDRPDASQSGIADVEPDGRIVRFVEKPRQDEMFSHWVNAGMLVLEPAVIDLIPDGASDFGRELLPLWIGERRRVFGYTMAPPENLWWIDTHEDLARVRAEFDRTSGRPHP